uniref:Uncharacterized protein n=1 Tax=Psilocybe cubensis TaxID=181762 RepID=A0A8H7Y2A8_PSICU
MSTNTLDNCLPSRLLSPKTPSPKKSFRKHNQDEDDEAPKKYLSTLNAGLDVTDGLPNYSFYGLGDTPGSTCQSDLEDQPVVSKMPEKNDHSSKVPRNKTTISLNRAYPRSRRDLEAEITVWREIAIEATREAEAQSTKKAVKNLVRSVKNSKQRSAYLTLVVEGLEEQLRTYVRQEHNTAIMLVEERHWSQQLKAALTSHGINVPVYIPPQPLQSDNPIAIPEVWEDPLAFDLISAWRAADAREDTDLLDLDQDVLIPSTDDTSTPSVHNIWTPSIHDASKNRSTDDTWMQFTNNTSTPTALIHDVSTPSTRESTTSIHDVSTPSTRESTTSAHNASTPSTCESMLSAHNASTLSTRESMLSVYNASTPSTRESTTSAHDVSIPSTRESTTSAHNASTPSTRESMLSVHNASTPSTRESTTSAHDVSIPSTRESTTSAHNASTPSTRESMLSAHDALTPSVDNMLTPPIVPSQSSTKLSLSLPQRDPSVQTASLKRPYNGLSNSHRSRKYQRTLQYNKHGHTPKPSLLSMLPSCQPEALNVKLDTLPATQGAYGAKPTKPHKSHLYSLDAIKALGFRIIPWDRCTPVPFVSEDGRIFMVLAGRPKDPAYERATEEAFDLLREAGHTTVFTHKDYSENRGHYPALNIGVTHGVGTHSPLNRVQRHPKITAKLLQSESIQQMASFASSAFATWSPKVYNHYKLYMDKIFANDSTLVRLFRRSIFPAATFNLGSVVCTIPHFDIKNCPYGWCAIQSLGKFNAKKGGHFVVWGLKVAIEFPAGSTILMLSAVLEHSNTSIEHGEERASFTQYASGGLFRWVDYGYRTEKELKRTNPKLYQEQMELRPTRWKRGLGMLCTLQDLISKAAFEVSGQV